jgi:UDP-glucose 4-epimerase
MSDTILVTGGAGYIGSHACLALAEAGYLPVTYDSLETGWRDAVQFGPFEQGDLRDRARLDAVMAAYKPRAVLHFAALSNVGEASADPARYWDNNVIGSLRLLQAMAAAGIRHIVFSSTCATYGDQDGVLLDETAPQRPTNAYGASKRAVEEMIAQMAAAPGADLSHVVFRYFNVAGADPGTRVGEFHRPETHLIPLALDAVRGRRDRLTIHGQDYPTPDGTCVRDYVHVTDLVAAHVAGLEYLLQGGAPEVFNLGSGRGYSVREVVETVARVTGAPVPAADGPRRPGDCAALVSGSSRAAERLGWQAQSSLEDMIATAWAWHQRPGYRA